MKWYRVIINDKIIAYNIKVADNFFKRLVGLLSREKLENDEGLLLKKCNQIHTFGMKFNIDAIFISKKGEIVYIENNMQAGKVSKYIKDADHVLELQAGIAQKYNVQLNQIVTFDTL